MNGLYSNVRIARGGKLLADRWDYNRDTGKGEMIRDINIRNQLTHSLHKRCSIDEGVVLEDILLLLDFADEYLALSPVLTGAGNLEAYVLEGLKYTDERSEIEQINIGWKCHIQESLYYEGQSVVEEGVEAYGKANSETYALEFTPVNKIAHCKVELDRRFTIKENDTFVVSSYKDFTLYDILRGLFWELSFHGSPKQRDGQMEELYRRIDEIDEGKGVSWDEVKERIKGNGS